MPTGSRANVAVYIDFDNIVMSRYDQVHRTGRRDTPWRSDNARDHRMAEDGGDVEQRLWRARVDVGAILDYASSFGSIVISRAYADWSVPANAGYRREVVDRAIDLTQLFTVTTGLKNGADIRLSVDVVEDLFRLPDVTHVVIVAGDSDYIALAQRSKRLGRVVVGVGVAGSTSSALISACDVFTLYDDLPDVETTEPTTEEYADPAGSEEPAREPRGRKGGAKAGGGADRATQSAQDKATNDLVRAMRLVEQKNDDSDDRWQFPGEVKQQLMRLNPAFKEKALGYRTFTEFLASRPKAVEMKADAAGDTRRVRSVQKA